MHIHKYKVGDTDLYVISNSTKKPIVENTQISAKNWAGYSTGQGRDTASGILKSLSFTKEAPEKEEEEAPKGEKTSITLPIRQIAEMIRNTEEDKRDPHSKNPHPESSNDGY